MQGMVPPLDRPLQRYGLPDRDLSALQGWGAERNRELGSERDGNRKRARRAKKEDDDSDETDQSVPPPQHSAAFQNGIINSEVVRPSDMHVAPSFERVNTSTSESLGFVPPNGNGLPLNDVDMGFSYSGSGGPGSHPVGPASHPSGTGVTPDGGIASISPVDNTSFSVSLLDGSGGQGLTSYPNQQGIFGLLNGSRPTPSPNSVTAPQPHMSDSLGSQDPRPNIVKRGLITNNDALGLVN